MRVTRRSLEQGHSGAHVPQLEILERAAAFVTHGGMNSVSESLFHGVPIVVIPQMSEQEFVARRTEELGAGVFLSKESVTPQSLRAAVDRLLSDDEFKGRARAIGESFRAAGGVMKAADAVLAFTRVYRASHSARVCPQIATASDSKGASSFCAGSGVLAGIAGDTSPTGMRQRGRWPTVSAA